MANKSNKLSSIAFGATIGTTMEWYDFFIAGLAAATVWPIVFFPTFSPAAALAASLSSYVVTFITRPIGGYIFGHFGDKLGRKSMLVWTLSLMGISSFGIALVPSYATIGLGGPALIILFRIILGLGLGGEWGGASAWILEFSSKSKHRGFWSGWVNTALGFGVALAAGLFTLVRIISPSTFVTIGWRIPFVIGGFLIIIGIVIRYYLSESPVFDLQKEKGLISRAPAAEVLKKYARKIFTLGFTLSYVIAIQSGVILAFAVPFLVGVHHMDPTIVYSTIIVAAVVSVVTTELGAITSDRLGNKVPLIISIVLTIVFIYPYVLMLETLNLALIFLAQAILGGVCFYGYGVLVRLFGGNFETKYRYSGAGLVFQIGAAYGSVIAIIFPLIGAQKGGIGGIYVVILTIVMCILSLIPAVLIKGGEQFEATV